MAMVINGGVGGGPVGPGIYVFVSGMSGPTPTDDYVLVEICNGSHVNVICSGTVRTLGSTFVSVIPGIHDGGPALNASLPDHAIEATVQVIATQFHANGTYVDGVSGSSDYIWHPTTGLWYLHTAVAQTDISDIRAAVLPKFSNS